MSDNYTFGKGLLKKFGHQVSSKNEKKEKDRTAAKYKAFLWAI